MLRARSQVVASVPAVAAEPIAGASAPRLVETLGAILRLGHRAAGWV
jgi:hypothetical protein